MIAGVRLVEHWEPVGIGLPVEITAIDDDATDRVAVAAYELGCRMHDNRGTVIKRAAQDGRGGIVHDQWHAKLTANCGDFRDWEDL